MVNTRSGLAVIVTSCLAAVGAGGFLANRYSAAPAPPTTVAGPAESGPGGANPAEAAQPVHETEAVMDEGPVTKATAAASTSGARSRRRVCSESHGQAAVAGTEGCPDRRRSTAGSAAACCARPATPGALRPSGRETGCFASADRACRPLGASSAGGGRLSNRPATR